MVKKPNLAEIAQAAGSTRRQPVPVSATAVREVETEENRETASPRAKSRLGTKQVAGHFPEEVAWQLRELAVEQRSTVQELLGEALNDLFQKYGKPELLSRRQKGLT